jgi:hypothetical protein
MLYGPLFADAVDRKVSMSRRLNGSYAEEAIELLGSLGARRVFIYAMGEEPWLQHVVTSNYTPTPTSCDRLKGYASGVRAVRWSLTTLSAGRKYRSREGFLKD